ncbi:hypothetical protein BH09GEM1_BH09GEM1_14820 [soil metagenome]
MSSFPRSFLASLAIVATASSAAGAQVIDRSAPASGALFSNIRNWTGQSFHPNASTIAGGGLNLVNVSGGTTSGVVDVQLWSDLPSSSGSFLAGGSTTFSLGGGEAAFFDVFWNAVSVTLSPSYYLLFQASYAGPEAIYSTYASRSYASDDGNAVYNASSDITAPFSGYGYILSYNEYSAAPITTPEPASATLLAAGLVATAIMTRRKRRRS